MLPSKSDPRPTKRSRYRWIAPLLIIALVAFIGFQAFIASHQAPMPAPTLPGQVPLSNGSEIQTSPLLYVPTDERPSVSNPNDYASAEVVAANPDQNYYVSRDGSDSNPGILGQPWRTLKKAASVLRAGDTLYIRGGVYTESVDFFRSGTSTAPISVLAYPGESPVIDGSNDSLPSPDWNPLVKLSGEYIIIAGLEIRYSGGMGLALSGKHTTADRINAHHNRQNGILIAADYGLVQNSQVWSNCMSNVNGGSSDGWASGLSAARAPNYAVIRKNVVYGNWGEGLSTYEANGTLIEDNIVHDNWSANVYISDATRVLAQRNFVYTTGAMTGGTQVGIMLGDEKYKPPSANIEIINNIVYGANRNFYWWQGTQGGGMNNVTIANNTFVNSTGTAGVIIAAGPHQNVSFSNNLILQEDPLPVATVAKNSELHFSNNLWSKAPSSAAVGPGDVVGDPQLTKSGSQYTPQWFMLSNLSPAIDQATSIPGAGVDYFGNRRGAFFDMGANELVTP